MGYIRHVATVVTCWDRDLLERVHSTASGKFPTVSPIVESEINGYCSFLIPSSGSNLGWDTDVLDRSRRSFFIDLCRLHAHDDGSNPIRLVNVEYGENEPAVITHEIGHPSVSK